MPKNRCPRKKRGSACDGGRRDHAVEIWCCTCGLDRPWKSTVLRKICLRASGRVPAVYATAAPIHPMSPAQFRRDAEAERHDAAARPPETTTSQLVRVWPWPAGFHSATDHRRPPEQPHWPPWVSRELTARPALARASQRRARAPEERIGARRSLSQASRQESSTPMRLTGRTAAREIAS